MLNTEAKSQQLIVAVGVICRNDEVLLALRPKHVHKGGLWEFPGGKVDSGETVEQALIRELNEELGVTPTAFTPLIKISHDYPEKTVVLDVWRIEQFDGVASGVEGQQIRWVKLTDLDNYQFPEANQSIIDCLV